MVIHTRGQPSAPSSRPAPSVEVRAALPPPVTPQAEPPGARPDVEALRAAGARIAGEPADVRQTAGPSSHVSSRGQPAELVKQAQGVLDALATHASPLGFVADVPVRKLRMALHPDRLVGLLLSPEAERLAERAIVALNTAANAVAPSADPLQKAAYAELHAQAKGEKARARAEEAARAEAEAERARAAEEVRARAAADAERLRAALDAVKDHVGAAESLVATLPTPSPRAASEQRALTEHADVKAAELEALGSTLTAREPRLAANQASAEELDAAAAQVATMASLRSTVGTALESAVTAEAHAKAALADAEVIRAKLLRSVEALRAEVGAARALARRPDDVAALDAAMAKVSTLETEAADTLKQLAEQTSAWTKTAAALRTLDGELTKRVDSAARVVDHAHTRRTSDFRISRADFSDAEWAARITFARSAVEAQLGAVETSVAAWLADEAQWDQRARGAQKLSPDMRAMYARRLGEHEATARTLGTRVYNATPELSRDVQAELPQALFERAARLRQAPLTPRRREHLFASDAAWQARTRGR